MKRKELATCKILILIILNFKEPFGLNGLYKNISAPQGLTHTSGTAKVLFPVVQLLSFHRVVYTTKCFSDAHLKLCSQKNWRWQILPHDETR